MFVLRSYQNYDEHGRCPKSTAYLRVAALPLLDTVCAAPMDKLPADGKKNSLWSDVRGSLSKPADARGAYVVSYMCVTPVLEDTVFGDTVFNTPLQCR